MATICCRCPVTLKIHLRSPVVRSPLRTPLRSSAYLAGIAFENVPEDPRRAHLSSDSSEVRPLEKMPGLALNPSLLFRLVRISSNLHLMHQEFWKALGRMYKIPVPFGQPYIITNNPADVEVLFRTDGETPYRAGFEGLEEFFEDAGLRKGLVLSNWEEWRLLRTKCNKQIVPRRVLEFTPLINAVTEDLLQHLRDNRGLDNSVEDVVAPLMEWSFEGIGIFILNERLNMLTNPSARMKTFQKAAIQFIKGLLPMASPIPLHKYIPTIYSVRFENTVRELEQISLELLDEKMAALSAALKEGGNVEPIGFLEQWLVEERLDHKDIFVLIRDFLSAGIDTTSIAAAYMLYALARRPDVQQRLREEVLAVVGPSAMPNSQHLQKMQYAKSIITETLRRYPVIGFLSRKPAKDIVLSGYSIPAGSLVTVGLYNMAHDPEVFESPWEFLPERWSRATKKQTAFANIPFGFGPRGCYGRRLAELELLLLLTQVSRNFDLSSDINELQSEGLAVLKPVGPVRIQFNDVSK